MSSKGTPTITVRLDDEIRAEAEAEAKREGVTVSDVVRMALRKHLGLALIAMLALSACSAASASPKTAPADVAPVASVQRFTVETAQKFAAISGGTPLKVESRWACDQPMRISIAAAPGWTGEQVYNDMLYAITYVQALGYDVQVGAPTAYVPNMTQADASSTKGAVTVVVAPNRTDQPLLGNGVGITYGDTGSALVILDASRNGLLPDVILHEFGHVLGLDHREAGSVMSEGWANSGHFDADETASIICD